MTMLSRRRSASLLSALLGSALLLTACGDAEDAKVEPDAGENQVGVGSEDSEETGGADYPVTVDTVYGEITVEEKPERIVAVVGPYADMLVALGEQPVAYVGASRAGDDFFAGYPWIDEADLALSGHDLALLTEGSYTPSLEAIASYEPDLILGQAADWAIDEQMYEDISQIAPTYTNPHEFGDWDQTLSDLAALTGKTEMVSEIVDSVDAAFAEAQERLPGLRGATFITADLRDQEIGLGIDRFLYEELGLEPDAELAGQESISIENLEELTSDVVEVFAWRSPTVQEELESDPRFDELPAVANETVVWADDRQVTAVEAGPASIIWWLEQVVPQLEESALNGQSE